MEKRGTHPNFDIDVKCVKEEMSSLTDKSMWMDVKLGEEGGGGIAERHCHILLFKRPINWDPLSTVELH